MQRIRKAIIPVAGMGTRFLPATKSTPKEMLPIVDIPSIQYIVDEAVKSGIEEILFVTSPYKNSIQDYFDRSYELEHRLEKSNKIKQLDMIKNIPSMAKFFYIRQGEPLGTGHAIRICEDFIGGEPFAVLYGDDIVKSDVPCLKQMISIYEKYDCNVMCAVELTDEEIPAKGILSYSDIESGKINGLVEKPLLENAPSHYGTIGRYILKPEIFDELRNIPLVNGEYLLTDAILDLMQKQDFYACKLDGEYHDIGNQFGYIKANISYGLDREEIREKLLDFIKEISGRN